MLVAGLGNPGFEYEKTRHNIGFQVVEELCRRLRKPLKAGRGDYLMARGRIDTTELFLLEPLTYMNNSGEAVADALIEFQIEPSGLIVVCDDFALPLGTLRLRAQGSDGGHNGLYSIIYHLRTDQFARLRCGIRKETMPAGDQMADFVLSPFTRDEEEAVGEMVGRAADAVTEFARSGLARAMNKFNT